MAAVSFDTGVLIALERNDHRAWAWMKRAAQRGEPPVVATAAVAEAWRGGRTARSLGRALHACDVRALDEPLARSAGEALATVEGGVLDAIVAATAANAGAVLVTDDLGDMQPFADGHFRGMRLAGLSRIGE
jgi:predicted nucleic acid-binding protein